MNGQWIGTYRGTNTGTVVADLDDVGTSYAGDVFVYDNNLTFPRAFAHVELSKGQNPVKFQTNLMHMERGSGVILPQQVLAQRFPGQVPSYVDMELQIAPNVISVKWKTDIGTNGDGKMRKSRGQTSSTLIPVANVNSWEEFKKYVLNLEPYQFAFRGHKNNKWRLRTAFHRTGRASLMKFMSRDVYALHRHLSGLTTHRFNLDDALDYAAFLPWHNITDIRRQYWIGPSHHLSLHISLLETWARATRQAIERSGLKRSGLKRSGSSFSMRSGGTAITNVPRCQCPAFYT